MTVFTIESDSEKESQMLLEYVKEHGLRVTTNEHRVLTSADMVDGIGRKATDAELTEYLLKGESSELIDIETVFADTIKSNQGNYSSEK